MGQAQAGFIPARSIINGETMNKPIDLFFGKLLKHWVAQHKPPVDARAKLLAAAAHATPKAAQPSHFMLDHRFYQRHALHADECAQVLFVLVNETIFRSGLQLRVI